MSSTNLNPLPVVPSLPSIKMIAEKMNFLLALYAQDRMYISNTMEYTDNLLVALDELTFISGNPNKLLSEIEDLRKKIATLQTMITGSFGEEAENTLFDDQVFLIGNAETVMHEGGVKPETDPIGWSGFYAKNNYPPSLDGNPEEEKKQMRICWRFFGQENTSDPAVSWSSLQGAYAVIDLRETELPYLCVYTKKKGDGADAGASFRSSETYQGANPATAKRYVIYFGANPPVYPKLPRIEFSLNAGIYAGGSRNSAEDLLSIAIETDWSPAKRGLYEFSAAETGFCLNGTWKRKILQLRKDFTREHSRQVQLLEQIERELLNAGGAGMTDEERALLLALSEDVEAIKGPEWTDGYSVMGNYMEIMKESITPKNIHVDVDGNVAKVSFSFEDHPSLSHFVLEYFDEAAGEWRPFNGTDGIVPKE